MKKKVIFVGWINPKNRYELPIIVEEKTSITFGNIAWTSADRKCKITVEWEETRKQQKGGGS